MRLGNRLTFLTAATGCVLLVLGASGAWYVLRLQHLNSQILDFNVSSIRTAEEMEILVRDTRYELDRFLFTGDISRLNRAIEKEQEVRMWLQQARDLSATDKEARLVKELQRDLDEFYARLREVLDEPMEERSRTIINSLAREILTRRVLVSTRQYLDLNEQELKNSSEQNKAMAERLALALLLLGTCGAIAGLVVGYGIARGISRSLFQLSVPIRDVAGKLNQVVGPVEVTADPTVGDLEAILQTVSDMVGAVVEQLHARHREVIRADQLAAVGQLAAGMAHEIRNPLMCIKTLVQSAQRRDGTGSGQLDARDLSVLNEEILRLEDLLQGFFDFARPAKPETRSVDLKEIVRQTLDLLSGKAEQRGVTIDHRMPAQALVVQADASQLRQVILNLLLNALDAVPNGGTIWVEAATGAEGAGGDEANHRPSNSVCLRVADNGQGLPDHERCRIYDPFFSTKETGLGLGLAVSQRIIEAHGGQLEAWDRPGGGAVFQIVLAAEPALLSTPA